MLNLKRWSLSIVPGLLGIVSVLSSPVAILADSTFVVAPGFDLFETDPQSTSFDGLGSLQGVPLGTFNFGGSVGTVATGQTDTIIQRLTTATASSMSAGATATVNINVVALQLETVNPVNFMGNGVDQYFVTLDPNKASTGSLTITWNANGLSGTFATSLDLDLDFRKGSLTGTVLNPGGTIFTLASSGTNWSDLPPTGAVLIDGANRYLSGTLNDPTKDFFNNPGPAISSYWDQEVAAIQPNSSLPEPSTLALAGLGLVGLAICALHRRSLDVPAA